MLAAGMSTPIVVLIHSQAPADLALRDALWSHLRGLPIELREPPTPGQPRAQALRDQLAVAALALVLVSKELAADEDACAALPQASAALWPILISPYAWASDPRLSPLHGREALPRGPATLAQHKGGARAKALADIAAEVERHLRAQRPVLPPSPSRGADPQGLRALWIELTRREDQIGVRCWNPYHGHYREVFTAPPRQRDPDGVALFHLLFPEAALCTEVLRDLAPGRAHPPAPSGVPLRVRIVTSDPVLAALPWARTRYLGEELRRSGWTFALCPRSQLGPSESVPYPLKVLLVADHKGTPLRAEIEELLRRVHGPELPSALYRVVFDEDAACEALRTLRPALVLLEGRASLSRLWSALCDDPPRLLCSVSAAAPADLPVLLRLCEHVPLQLWPRREGALAGEGGEPSAQRLVQRWLAEVLRGGRDPVELLHDEWPAEGDPLQIFANYHDLELSAGPGPGRLVQGPYSLDRDEARALAAKHVSELVNSPTRRVEVLIGYGGSQDHLPRLSEQAADFVKESLGVVLQREIVRFPRLLGTREQRKAQAAGLPQRLEEELRIDGGARVETPVWSVLRQRLRTHRGGGPQVLWLDYGVFGEAGADGAPELLKAELSAFADFARDRLGRDCPAHVRLVVYLGHLVEPEGRGKFRARLEALEEDPQLYTARFRFTVLPALGQVTRRHLRDYTSDPLRSTCDGSLAREAADLIFTATGGEYAAAVQLLERGEREGYAALVRALSQAARPGGDDDDE